MMTPGYGHEAVRGRAYCWRPFIGFEDTNLVGNVYFAHFISWQGRCREAFLAEHAPDVLALLANDLRLVTLSVSCDFYEELRAFDELTLEMRLASRHGHRLGLAFDYQLQRDDTSRLAARGDQEVACMRVTSEGRLIATELPESLAVSLQAFS